MGRDEDLLPKLAVLVVVAIFMLFGGTSQVDIWYNIPVRLTAVAVIAWLLLSRHWERQAEYAKLDKVLIGLILAIPLFQIIPLPSGLWTALGDRETLFPLYAAIGVDSPWLPVSLTPSRTLDALFWLLVPFAGFLAGRVLPWTSVRVVLFTLLGLTFVGLLLGLIQISQGEGGTSYLYSFTNFGSAVGFFANRNHHGALLASCIPFAYLLVFTQPKIADERKRHLIAAGLAFLLTGGAILTESRAAIVLALAAWGASVVLIGGKRTQLFTLALRGGVAVMALLLIFQDSIFERFGRLNEGFNRAEVYPMLQSMIGENWFIGTGIGSFRWAALGYENPAILGPSHWNHAHNDWAQILAEAGLPGLAVILLGCLWLFRNRPLNAAGEAGDPLAIPAMAAWAGWIVVILLLTHSIVDYPIRTSTLAALFGLCLGWLAKARATHADAED